MNKNIFNLSGGEKQKIAIASIYALNPEIFILDEPSSSLDIKSMKELSLTIKKLKSLGKNYYYCRTQVVVFKRHC